MSAVGCFGRFTFSHLAFHIPTLAGSCLCLFCVFVCLVVLFLCFWFLFCKCLGIPNSPRSLDLDDRQGLIARSAMQQKKKICGGHGRYINRSLTDQLRRLQSCHMQIDTKPQTNKKRPAASVDHDHRPSIFPVGLFFQDIRLPSTSFTLEKRTLFGCHHGGHGP